MSTSHPDLPKANHPEQAKRVERAPLLSILTPSLPERIDTHLKPLCAKLRAQIERDSLPGQVEHLVFLDNRARNVGQKRTTMLAMARGRYLAFVDDDDDVSSDYVKSLVAAISSFPLLATHSSLLATTSGATAPDVITFLQRAIIEGREGICEWRLGHPNEAWAPLPEFETSGSDSAERGKAGREQNSGQTPGGEHAATVSFRRPPWHCCAWRTELAQRFEFPPTNDGEDWAWAQQANAAAQSSHHIPEILHTYRYDPAVSAATPGVSFFRPRLSWQDIPGWFDFPEVYAYAVHHAPEKGATFVEIGTWLGQSTAFMLGLIQQSGKRIDFKSIDTFKGSVTEPAHQAIVEKHGGSIIEAARANLASACGPDGPSCLIEADSSSSALFYADGTVDFCFIDADHTEPAVRRDITAWLPKMKPGGILAGHDIDSPGVYAAVKAILDPIYNVKQSGRCWIVIIPEDIGAE